MAKIGEIILHIDTAPMRQSLGDLAALIADVEVPSDLAERIDAELLRIIDGGCMLRDDDGDLVSSEAVHLSAGGARQVKCFQFHPSDGYLVLFTAVARDRKADVAFRHGWPILSLAGDTASMAEAAGASSLSRGGEGA